MPFSIPGKLEKVKALSYFWNLAVMGFGAGLAGLSLASCSVVRLNDGSVEGRRMAIDAIRLALTSGDCTTAVRLSKELYEASTSDNEVRTLYMSAKACAGGLSDFFSLLTAIVNRSGQLALPGGLWKVTTELFYVSSSDSAESRMAASWSAYEAGFSILKDGITVSPFNAIHSTSVNPGSLLVSDRTDEANFYLTFVFMAAIGNAQTRYGAPDSTTFAPTQILGQTVANPSGWTSYSFVDEATCGYAASVVGLIDSIDASSTLIPATYGDVLGQLSTLYGSELDNACEAACKGATLNGVDYSTIGCGLVGAQQDGCRGESSERPCLRALRNRSLCADASATDTLTKQARCAAAGIAKFITEDPISKWQ